MRQEEPDEHQAAQAHDARPAWHVESLLRGDSTSDRPERSRSLRRSTTRPSGRKRYNGRVHLPPHGRQPWRKYRVIDFKRNKVDIPAKVATIVDPNRSARIALLVYADGEAYPILAPDGLEVGRTVVAGKAADILVGNSLKASSI